VQLETKHNGTLTLPPTISGESPAPSATKLLALIKEFEGSYQDSLSETYHDMGEKSFKSLRRALPLTRQKLDWEKVRDICPLVCFNLTLSSGSRIQARTRASWSEGWRILTPEA
jgi:hypothetical protein